MTTIGEAFDALGYALTDSETVAIVTVRDGFVASRRLQDVRDEPIGENTYYSTGTFPSGTTFRRKGDRSAANVMRILALPFDFDLKDFLMVDKGTLYDLDDDELQSYIAPMREAIEEMFRRLALPIHRLDYTGYGMSAHVTLPLHKQDHVGELKKLHAGIVKKINGIFGGTFADPQVSDAGSRIMRLPGCLNVGAYEDGRHAPPRQSATIARSEGGVTATMLQAAAGTIAWQGQPIDLPSSGETLSPDEVQAIVEAYRPYHQLGVKHFMALGIAAQLGKAGVPEAQALAIIEAISADDAKPWDRRACVRDTYAKLREGASVSGFYRLRGIVDDDVLRRVDSILDRVKTDNHPRLTFIGKKRDRATMPEDDPIKLFNPPIPPQAAFYGWHGRYLDLVYPTTSAAIAFHLAASLTLQAAMMGRRVSVFYGEDLYPNQYSVVVGPTGSSFKDTAFKRTIRMVEHAQRAGSGQLLSTPFNIVTDVASREAIIRTLSRHNNMYLFATEITAVLKNAHRESTSTLLDALINIWDSPAVIQNNSIAAAQDGTNIAREPTLNIYGGIQPTRMADHMTEEMMISGLGNRLAIYMGNGRAKLSRMPEMDIQGANDLYRELNRKITAYPFGTQLVMTDDAGVRWDDWFNSITEETEELANDMKVRYPVMVQKWALLFAVSDGANAIEVPHIDAAVALADWMWDCVRRLLPSWGTSSERRIEERVIAVLQQRQPIEKRLLAQYVRGKWTSREVASVLRSLKEVGMITYSVDDRLVSLAEYAERHAATGGA